MVCFFFQEKILAKRRRRRGGYEYYIKWVGYDESANEWIPASSLNCPDRLAEFQREEAQKQKRSQKEKVRSQKRRKNKNHFNNRVKKRRVKIIDNDDDDDDVEEPVKSVESSHSTSIKSDKDRKNNSITYGVEKGYKVQAILGINRT